MKKIIYGFLFICFGINCSGQSKRMNLKVYGTCSSVSEKIGKKITLKIIVDRNKCDPEIGFISLDDKLFHLEESLVAKGINFSEFERSFKSGIKRNIETEIYSYVGQEKQIEEIIGLAKNQEIEISSIIDLFSKKSLKDQDEKAICALRDVIEKAEFISKSLGYENCDLKSVDDDTSGVGISSLSSMLASMSYAEILSGGSVYSIVGYFEVY